MANRFSRRLLFGYSVSKVEDYIREQADYWKLECEKRDSEIAQLKRELEDLKQQLELRKQQDGALVQALAHAERMSQANKGAAPAKPASAPPADKTQMQKRVDDAIRKNMQSLEALRSRLEKSAPVGDPLAQALEALEPSDQQVPAQSAFATALGLGAAFPGADLSQVEELESPPWREMLHREYEQGEPALVGLKHDQLQQATRDLGIE